MITIEKLCEELNARKEELKKKYHNATDKARMYKLSGRLDECDYMLDKFCK